MAFISSPKRDGIRARQDPRTALSGSVDQLRELGTPRQIQPHDAVVVRPAGIEPADLEELTLKDLAVRRTLMFGQAPGRLRLPLGSVTVPQAPGGATKAVKLG